MYFFKKRKVLWCVLNLNFFNCMLSNHAFVNSRDCKGFFKDPEPQGSPVNFDLRNPSLHILLIFGFFVGFLLTWVFFETPFSKKREWWSLLYISAVGNYLKIEICLLILLPRRFWIFISNLCNSNYSVLKENSQVWQKLREQLGEQFAFKSCVVTHSHQVWARGEVILVKS